MNRVFFGDCRTVMRELIAQRVTVDSIVTDPPYELGFMGRKWDSTGIAFNPEVWALALQLLKPGGHLLAFAGSRTYHRIACAIEDAGFEIRDQIMWIYGSGFPKSLDVGKAIDKMQRGGMVREKLLHFAAVHGIDGKWLEVHGVASASSFNDWTVGGHVPSDKNWQLVKIALGVTLEEEAAFERAVVGRSANGIAGGTGQHTGEAGAYGFAAEFDITAPATDAAKTWQGWGTALKPAHEPIVVARKPMIGTVAENVQRHGTGAINVDECRVHADDAQGGKYTVKRLKPGATLNKTGGNWRPENGVEYHDKMKPGRWPANVIHDGSEEVLGAFPDAPGQMADASSSSSSRKTQNAYGAMKRGNTDAQIARGDTGSAARFFYCAKATSKERKGSQHPTIKPLALMRYLCRLVTPPGGLILDPFAGSGTTAIAALAEGMQYILIEKEADHIRDISLRMSDTQTGLAL